LGDYPNASSASFAANELVYVAQQRNMASYPLTDTETAYGPMVTITAPAGGS